MNLWRGLDLPIKHDRQPFSDILFRELSKSPRTFSHEVEAHHGVAIRIA